MHVAATREIEPANERPTVERCADLERRAPLARLAYRGKRDPIICRAARRLQQDDPGLSLERLAAELGVSESYLSRGLQAALGQSPARLFG